MLLDKVNAWILTTFEGYARNHYNQFANSPASEITFLNFKIYLKKNVTGVSLAQKNTKDSISNLCTLLIFFLTMSLQIWIAGLRKEYELPVVLDYVIFTFGFAVVFLSILLTKDFVDDAFEFSFKKTLFAIHAIIPNKQEREKKTINMIKACINPGQGEVIPILSTTNHFRAPPYLSERDYPLVQEFNTTGIKNFCKKYFNKSGAGFIRFIQERAQKVEPRVLDSFLDFAVNLPKVTQMSPDSLRKILIAQHPAFNLRKHELEMIFQDYSPLQIERIYTNYVGKQKYADLILITKPAKIYATFQDLLESELYHAKTLPDHFRDINGTEVDFLKIKVLETYRDYVEASDTFRNCLRNYITRDGFVITFYHRKIPAICVWVNEGRICEYTETSPESRSQKYRPFITKLLTDKGILT